MSGDEPRDEAVANNKDRAPRLVLAFCGALLAAALAAPALGLAPPAEVRIALGFFAFFVAPGLLFIYAFMPRRFIGPLETYPLAIALSMGVWAFPGLAAYVLGSRLSSLLIAEAAIIAALYVLAALRLFREKGPPARDPGEAMPRADIVAVLAIVIGMALAALYTGAFRGVIMDWDYFNYISHVNKLMSWGRADIGHFAYADAPPDPIHSYNIWALQWALIGKAYGVDPIALYLRPAWLTVPAALLAFYAMARGLAGAGAARSALILYAAYHLVYGGMLFLGRTTLYPADSQWLLVFPSCVALFLKVAERLSGKKDAGTIAGLALAVLGLSITHVLWGLCFYVVVCCYWIAGFPGRREAWNAIGASWKTGPGRAMIAALALFAAPLVVAIVASASAWLSGDIEGRDPILGPGFGLIPWLLGLVFAVVPLGAAAAIAWARKPRGLFGGAFAERSVKVGVALLACGVVALPYAWLRYRAIGATAWEQFGRNPYQMFLTATTFFLNPFQRSLANPNMTFYPMYMLGYLCLPRALRGGLGHRPGHPPAFLPNHRARAGMGVVLAVMILVPLVCFHPVLATIFADLFSLGYLRRFLRLAAMFSFVPAGVVLHRLLARLLDPEARPALHSISVLAAALSLSALAILFPAKPNYYNRMLRTTLAVAANYPPDSLIHDDTPFRAIKEGGWFGPGDVIFSDFWTSYRLTAYLPQYVAAQHKPGTGVKDQDERRRLEEEFFSGGVTAERMLEILGRFGARGIVVNTAPSYRLYGVSCGHPHTAGKLRQRPDLFEVLYEEGDWAVFRRR